MLTKRIIPCLDINKGRVVKGINFLNLKDAGDPVEVAMEYDRQSADELVFLDITASFEKRDIIVELVNRVAAVIFIPFTVGGGLKTTDDIRDVLKAGADKVSLNTAAVKNKMLIKEGAEKFGSQCIVVAIDCKRKTDSVWEVYINGGRTSTGIDVLEWVEEVQRLGAGELLVTSMDTDGTKSGYDINLLDRINSISNIPIIASGGAGTPEDIYNALTAGKADAALAASIFHYNEYTVNDIKKYLIKKGLPMRLLD